MTVEHFLGKVTQVSPLKVDFNGSGGSAAQNPTGFTFAVGATVNVLTVGSTQPLVFPIR